MPPGGEDRRRARLDANRARSCAHLLKRGEPGSLHGQELRPAVEFEDDVTYRVIRVRATLRRRDPTITVRIDQGEDHRPDLGAGSQVDLQQDCIRSYRDARRLQEFIEPMRGRGAWKRHCRD